jgi:hypothetical protein
MDLTGPISRVFHVISSTYGWDDDVILNKSLRRIRQMVALISEERTAQLRNERLQLSWQTRSLAMVIAAAGSNASEDLMKFASNLTIDKEEYEEFGGNTPNKAVQANKGIPVNGQTQELAAKRNLEAAADANANSAQMLNMFGHALEKGKPGHD